VTSTRPAWPALAAAAIALGLAGCGGSSRPAGGPPTGRGPTTTAAATTAALPGANRPQIVLGDKNTPEQFVLGELYVQALQAQGFQVSLDRNIGPPSVSLDALSQGSLDVYPEYLNVFNAQLVGDGDRFGSLRSAYAVAQTWAGEHDLELLRPTPFSDAGGLAVTTGFAGANQVRTMGDLRHVSSTLTIGAPAEFTQGALPALERTYRFRPDGVTQLDIGAQYDALRLGEVQAAYVSTTDGELSAPGFVVLRDPRHVLGFGNVVPVVPQAVVKAEGPMFARTINRVDRLLTTNVMRQLNAEVVVHGDPAIVARKFLQTEGLVAPPASGSA
jgi:osmoprotectant transport system substrate-binding protein